MQEIYCLERERTSEDRLEVISSKNVPTSNFSALLAEQQLSEVRPIQVAELHELNDVALGNNAIKQVWDCFLLILDFCNIRTNLA